MIGLKPEHYLHLSPIGQEILDNKEMFLSKLAIYKFGGYANEMLRRLDTKSAKSLTDKEQETHILNSIKNAMYDYKAKYFDFNDDQIKLYVDDSNRDDIDSEIFMDINLHHYPLRDYKSMWSEMNNIVKEYSKLGHRNKNAMNRGKLSKHQMHLVRLYLMVFDILEKHEINTYRKKEHEFLMSIRNGDYLDENQFPTKEFNDILNELEKRLEYDKVNTDLPDKPNYKRINEFIISVNEKIVKGEI